MMKWGNVVVTKKVADGANFTLWGTLDENDKDFKKFTKVMPREYKRVLLAQAKAKKDGTDPMEAVMEVSRG